MVMAHGGQRVQSQAATESGDGSLRVAGVGPLGVEPAEGETDTIGAGSQRRVAFFGVEDVLEVQPRVRGNEKRLILICGHYEGFDERIRFGLAAREISIGDYVLSGGEPAAMVLIDSIIRLLPGALGNESAVENDSFSCGLLEYPQYTRPRDFRGMTVPDILLSGNHAAIRAWREDQARSRTASRRPDLTGPDLDA
ncbi:MAG: hypothetical protein IIB57_06840 [Planctomycetes bacterium]|nr:hypothetical protein [Planctomycetota bacterium]